MEEAEIENKQAETECLAALAIDPKNSYLRYYLGDAQQRFGEIELAIDAWRRAANDAPTWHLPAVRLINAFLEKGRPDLAADVAAFLSHRDSASHDADAMA